MRVLSLALFAFLACAAQLCAAEPAPTAPAEANPAAHTWPLWDGKETVAEYAQRVNLPPTKTLDLGNGVTLELVLIPAWQFVMGTAEPVLKDFECHFRE